MDNKLYYSTKRDIFYYIEITDKQRQRDNKLSALFDEDEKRFFMGCDSGSPDKKDTLYSITDLKYARFFKDRKAAGDSVTITASNVMAIQEMDADTFINLIPDKYEIDNFITKRNVKMKAGMLKSMKVWLEHRRNYKAISAYKRVTNPSAWAPCKICGLIPLVWEYNNGRGTACGCGENEYNHHSIHAECIMSYVSRHNGSATGYHPEELRMNWNQWVAVGQDIFKQQKEINPKIW
jgi:hypothetical protein